MTPIMEPCPFCKSRCVTATINEHGWKVVECDDCGARGPCIELESDLCIERWNTRATITTPAPGRDALRERIARFLCDYDLYHGAWDGEKLCNEGTGRVWPNDKAKPYWLQADEFMKRADAILSALPVAPVVDEAAIRADEREKQRHADWRTTNNLTRKWGNPNGTQYEQGAQDHGVRIALALRAGGGER